MTYDYDPNNPRHVYSEKLHEAYTSKADPVYGYGISDALPKSVAIYRNEEGLAEARAMRGTSLDSVTSFYLWSKESMNLQKQQFEKECQDLWQKVYEHSIGEGSEKAEENANKAVESYRKAFSPSWESRVVKWGKDRNLIGGSSAAKQLEKLLEEIGELATAVATNDLNEIEDGIGDASVVLCLMAEMSGLTYSECLEKAWSEIKDRKGKMVDGVFVKEESSGEKA